MKYFLVNIITFYTSLNNRLLPFSTFYRLKRIPDDLMDLPSQAICCELAGIFPPEDLNRFDEFFRGTQWPISTLKAVYEIVADKRLIACILVRHNANNCL